MVLDDASAAPPPSDPHLDDESHSSSQSLQGLSPSELRNLRLTSPLVRVDNPGSPDPLIVDLTLLPAPPFRGNLWGTYANQIQLSCAKWATDVGRPLRQEEAEALAAHHLKVRASLDTVGVVSPLVAAGLTFRGRKTLRFPGWTPDPAKYSVGRFGPLLGRPAWLAWLLLRYGVYGLATNFGLTVLGFSWGISTASAGAAVDPRLQELNRQIFNKSKAAKAVAHGGIQPPAREVDMTAGPRAGETWEMARQRNSVQEARRRGQQGKDKKETTGDDMSPTSGAIIEGTKDSSADTGFMSDSQMAKWEEVRSPTSDSSRIQAPRSSSPVDAPPIRDFFDDASPTAADPSSMQPASGSAWDRVRQQAASGTPSKTTSHAKPDDDPFGVTQSDDDRRRAEAQREFDARIERERAGKDFDESFRGPRR